MNKNIINAAPTHSFDVFVKYVRGGGYDNKA